MKTMNTLRHHLLMAVFIIATGMQSVAQDWNAARAWNEELLYAITQDFGRPTVHARNLWHSSMAMYDVWAAYEPTHDTYLLGKTQGAYFAPFEGVSIPEDAETLRAHREEAISFAMYRLMLHRFQNAPQAGYPNIIASINQRMDDSGYDRFNTSADYINGGPAEFGNYVAQQVIAFGFTDGSNEQNGYANQVYFSQNDTIFPESPGNPTLINPNWWQPISLSGQLDQAGNPIFNAPPHLSGDWGFVHPFALTEEHMEVKERDGMSLNVYMDVGPPPYMTPGEHADMESLYKWGFAMVSAWESFADPDDDTMWDISPGGMGNVGPENYPQEMSVEAYEQFYNFAEGNTLIGSGYSVNPKTGLPYEPNLVKRADYTRTLGEFWADGPASYTPPGHWFEIVNHQLFDHPEFERKWMGEGEEMDDLEYEVKLYFTLGGAMHDVAVSVWSIKAYYDYIRPVSAIRYMCEIGQSTDSTLSNYHPNGMPLIPGFVEIVEPGDPLAGDEDENVGKIKVFSWKGPPNVTYEDEDLLIHPLDYAGVDWILGEEWWPFMSGKFVSPPFAGYISGHSTFSSTAAQVLENITGDPFFPGGMGVWNFSQNEFLEVEQGPSEDFQMQFATYRDASDQVSLSRIYIGIHPPQDDIPGRFLGMELGDLSVDFANEYFNSNRPFVEEFTPNQSVYNLSDVDAVLSIQITYDREMDENTSPDIDFLEDNPLENSLDFIEASWISPTTYQLQYTILNGDEKLDNIHVQIRNAEDLDGQVQNITLVSKPFLIDTDRPEVVLVTPNQSVLNDELAAEGAFVLLVEMNEECDTSIPPVIGFTSSEDLSSTLTYLPDGSQWIDAFHFEAHFDLMDNDEEIDGIGIEISGVHDEAGNEQEPFDMDNLFSIDTKNPLLDDLVVNNSTLNIQSIMNNALSIDWYFDEPMNTALTPSFDFPNDNPMGTSLSFNNVLSGWQSDTHFKMVFNLLPPENEFYDIVLTVSNFRDLAGNSLLETTYENLFIIDTKRPSVTDMQPSSTIISDSDVGTSSFQILISYDEPMDQEQNPVVTLIADATISNSIFFDSFASEWLDDTTFEARFDVADQNVEVDNINVAVGFALDAAGNSQNSLTQEDWIDLDTRNPEVLALSANTYLVTDMHTGDAGLTFLMIFDETMDQNEQPEMQFAGPVNLANTLVLNAQESVWINTVSHQVAYDVADDELQAEDIDVLVVNARDMAGNEVVPVNFSDYFSINITAVGVTEYGRDLGISAFPNPVQSGAAINLKLSEPIDRAVVQLLSATGQTMWQRDEARMEAGLHVIPMSGQASGMYFLRIQTADSSQIIRIAVVD